MKAKAEGADMRMVYSTLDAIRIAEAEPNREVVFFAIGFETTTPPTALALRMAREKRLDQFLDLLQSRDDARRRCAQFSTVRAEDRDVASRASSAPRMSARSSARAPYETFARDYGKPVVVAGFEPLDVMQAILMLIRQINEGRYEVENQYIRAVTRDGNRKARAEIAEFFELRRAIRVARPRLPLRQLATAEARLCRFDAEQKFGLVEREARDNPACECGAILRGVKAPRDCKLLEPSARPTRRWAPAWSRPRAPAPRTGPTAGSAKPRERGPLERAASPQAASSTSNTAASISRTARAAERWGN